MTVGRPRQFDRHQALDAAMEVFWKKGYEAASVADLLSAMSINRSSLYAAFGDKRALFLAVLDHYHETVTASLTATLSAPGSPVENIRRTLQNVGDSAARGGCRGCLMTNTTVETAPHDSEVAKAMRAALRRVENAFHAALKRAVACKELPDTNIRALARFLTGTLQGVVVLAKARLGKQCRDDVIATAMESLKQRRPAANRTNKPLKIEPSSGVRPAATKAIRTSVSKGKHHAANSTH